MEQLIKDITDAKSSKISRVTVNTLDGKDLRVSDIEQFAKILNFSSDESIIYLYCHDDKFEPKVVINGNIFVGITTHRVFKIENGGNQSIMRKDIVCAKHIKNNIFTWDRLEFLLNNNNKDSFGIYYSDTCNYFSNYINSNINNIVR